MCMCASCALHTPDPTNDLLIGVGYFYVITYGLQAYSNDKYINIKCEFQQKLCIRPPFILRKGGALQYRNKKYVF